MTDAGAAHVPARVERPGAIAHVAVLVGDEVFLQRRVERGRPVHRAPAAPVSGDETPGRAAERVAREQLGLDVRVLRVLHADTEHGAEHLFFLAEPVADGARPTPTEGVVPLRLAALLAYIVEPYALAAALTRERPPPGPALP